MRTRSFICQWPADRLQTVTKSVESLICTNLIHHKFIRSRIPDNIFSHLHKVHIVTRIRSRKGHPLGEKITIKMFRLEKTSTPPVHKNIPSVNTQLQVVKHLIIRIKPLKLPQGLPAEEDVCNACLRNMGPHPVLGTPSEQLSGSGIQMTLPWSLPLNHHTIPHPYRDSPNIGRRNQN
uniref:Large ribosomal subunit protein uL30m n=1 Tax=Bos mutus grunniens TaxID=30521 RepID=A0A8C0AE90_BOSMU